MAKKKNTKSAAQTDVAKQQKQENMKSKVEIKQPERNQEKMSRIVGSIFIGLIAEVFDGPQARVDPATVERKLSKSEYDEQIEERASKA